MSGYEIVQGVWRCIIISDDFTEKVVRLDATVDIELFSAKYTS